MIKTLDSNRDKNMHSELESIINKVEAEKTALK